MQCQSSHQKDKFLHAVSHQSSLYQIVYLHNVINSERALLKQVKLLQSVKAVLHPTACLRNSPHSNTSAYTLTYSLYIYTSTHSLTCNSSHSNTSAYTLTCNSPHINTSAYTLTCNSLNTYTSAYTLTCNSLNT